MSRALRLTDKTKFKIASAIRTPIEDVQAMMEDNSVGIIRPYVVLTAYSSETGKNHWLILSDDRFHSVYKYVDEEDPHMFREVTKR